MKNTLRTLLVVFAIPLLALGVSFAIELYQTGQLHKALAENFPQLPEESIRAVKLRDFLEGLDESEMREFRTEMRILGAVKVFAMAYILALGVVMLAIRLLGAACARDRKRLLTVFKPLYYLTSGLLVVSTPINAALAVGAIYYGEAYLLSRVHVWVILLAALAGLAGSYLVIKHALLGARDRPARLEGALAAPDSKIAAFVGEAARATGADEVRNIILGAEPTFFATEAALELVAPGGPAARLEGSSLYLSTSLCEYLSPEELRAVIGHELAHHRGLDTQYSLRFYPIYRGVCASLAELGAQSGAGLGASIALFPTMYVFGYFLDSFSRAEAALSREREALADRAGAELAGPEALGRALLKISLVANGMRRLREEGEEAEEGSTGPCPRDRLLADYEGKESVYLEEILWTAQGHPYDSHPLLKERLEGLGLAAEALAAGIDLGAPGKAREILVD